MRFRCCGSLSTEGHLPDCPLKPVVDAAVRAAEKVAQNKQGDECRFDILNFRHIGECKGTCDGEEEGIRFADEDDDGNVVVLLITFDLSEEEFKELERRGLKFLGEDEISELLERAQRGEIKIVLRTVTREILEKEYLEKPDEDPYMTIKEAAKALGFSESWTRTLCRDERLEGAVKLMRHWSIPHSAIYT